LRVESETGEKFPVIQTIENKDDGFFVIRVKVSDRIDKAEYKRKFSQKYKLKLKAKNKEIKLLNQQIKDIRQDNTKLIGVVKTMAEKEDAKFYLPDAKIVGDLVGRDKKANRDQTGGSFNDNSTNEVKQNLAETAK